MSGAVTLSIACLDRRTCPCNMTRDGLRSEDIMIRMSIL